jgi:GTP-binding protein
MIDRVDLEVTAGRGGDGSAAFHREKYVPRGGPDGGDGGRGGDVVLVAERRVSTLAAFHSRQHLRATDAQPGSGNQRRGASAPALRVAVPVGTVVWEVDETGAPVGDDPQPMADLAAEGDAVVVARGGRGGFGNRRFATPTRQAPRFAQRGALGQHRHLRLELKLLADVGLIGLPNAGKSTLLRAWSRATPKVGAYPFTTLEPELGVVEVGYDSFVAADMPGLIEGASAGVGLGHEFLRHIERTRVLVHVVDMTAVDPLADIATIDGELTAFGHGLAARPQLLALNKVDDPNARAHIELLQARLAALGRPWLAISAATGEGARELAVRTLALVREIDARVERQRAQEVPVLRPEPRRTRFEAAMGDDGIAVITGPTPEWLASTLPLENRDARMELFTRLRRLGVARALDRLGVEIGDEIRIGAVALRWEV